ncbi:replication protein [Alicyclobacillus sp. SO9]|uniref:replication protein n=1 Tax=Alicyclobacillus sp. SO9 TaxID=2665646 RepID=UPI0018E73CC8|nr:replication protein [Alicyclobacillus sp. SO9]QQE80901.1 replication protein [Alicyclobacillus sp. SO9]
MPKGDYQRLKADIEDGIVPIAHLLLEALSMAKLNGVAKGLVLFVWRRTYGWTRDAKVKYKEDRITLAEFAKAVNSERTYVSKQMKLLVKASVLYETPDPSNGRYKKYGMNTDIGAWDTAVIDIEALAAAVVDKLYVHSSKVVQKDNRCVNTQPCANEQPLSDSTTQPLRDRTTLTLEESRHAGENGVSKNSTKKYSTAATSTIPPISPMAEQEREIENVLRQHMGDHNYKLIGDDYRAFKEMLADGITMDIIKTAVQQGFERYEPRHKYDKISRFTYFRGVVYDLWDTLTAEKQVAATGSEKQRSRAGPGRRSRDKPPEKDDRYGNFYKLFPDG